MASTRQSILELVDRGYYLLERNVDIPLQTASPGDIIRANVYKPKGDGPWPALVTYGPYGKDIPYADFHPKSFVEVNPTQKSVDSAWETPDPAFWTSKGYVVVRADERGCGQSPGLLDSMSAGTADCFFDVVEWAASQAWSSGKVGLLGISYYAGSQWRVAAKQPNGLSAMIPWEGMSDYYRDRVRHGGILSNTFIHRWWNRQVVCNQYGLAKKAERNWGPDTMDGDLPEETLVQNRRDQTVDTARYRFRDEEYFFSKDFDLADIKVPLLSVANWGGILLHLRGNVLGYMYAGSKHKYLRFITGRHDLPFYYEESVALQLSFLDAFLKNEDRAGWRKSGHIPAIDLVLRKGNPGFNDAQAELKAFPRRAEKEWPIARTDYQKWHLRASRELSIAGAAEDQSIAQYEAPTGSITFETPAFNREVEITGHPTVRLSVSVSVINDLPSPKELDIFITLRHLDKDGKEIYYTGTTGDPVPITKGWLRASLRAVDSTHPQHRAYLPYRHYHSTNVDAVKADEVYTVDVEIWPTNVIISPGGRVALEIASCDTQGSGIFNHNHPNDRPTDGLRGWNNVHLGPEWENFVVLPVIPSGVEEELGARSV